MSVFCNPFDEALARGGPAAVFLRDPEGFWRFDPSWTRDAYGRAGGPHRLDWRYVLVRDRGSGYVQLVLCTSPTLLGSHPRGDVRMFEDLASARAARATFGNPPLCKEAW